MLKRKAYDKLLKWKNNSHVKTAVLIEGARRVGKSTLAETFGKNEYSSYLVIDFPTPNEAKVTEDYRGLHTLFVFRHLYVTLIEVIHWWCLAK